MPIIKKTVQAGPYLHITYYSGPTPRRVAGEWDDPPEPRMPRSGQTPGGKQDSNARAAITALELLLEANFPFGGSFLATLEWPDATRPTRRQDAVAEVQRYITRAGYALRASGCSWRYVYVLEELHGEGHMHVHLVARPETPAALDTALGAWRGPTWREPMDTDRWRSYRDLARYLLKERGTSRSTMRPGDRLYHACNGLIRPQAEYTLSSREEAETVPDNYKAWEYLGDDPRSYLRQQLLILPGYDLQRYRRYNPLVEARDE